MQASDFESLSSWRRATYCAALSQLNMNHILLFSELKQLDPKPAVKLMTKTWSFLEGELKSLDNLERFFNEFDEWQNSLLDDLSSFGAMAAQQACQSLYSAAYALIDESANDCHPIYMALQQLLDDMAEMGADHESLKQRQAEIDQEIMTIINSDQSRKNIVLNVHKLVSSETASSLGIELD
jgi:uncharacterized protein YjaG (DUF416 family)